MQLLIELIFLLLIAACLIIWFFLKRNSELDKLFTDKEKVQSELKKLQDRVGEAKRELDKLAWSRDEVDKDVTVLYEKRRELNKSILELNENLNSSLKNQEEISTQAYKTYCDLLDKKYAETDQEYNEAISLLKENYDKLLEENINTIHKLSEEINDLRATRQATIEAARREKLVQENTKLYCLELTDEDMADIAKLESIKKSLNKPRILSMLIWQTWFQKPLKTLSANLLGSKDVTGIYKITNVLTNECYVGQAVNVRERWAEHAKCGLGIDTPAGNKLYAAMKEYGIWSFSWELLEECPRAQLNEKEAFYISMYQSDIYGYNSVSAPKNKV